MYFGAELLQPPVDEIMDKGIDVAEVTESFICKSLGISNEKLDLLTELVTAKPVVENHEQSSESVGVFLGVLATTLAVNVLTGFVHEWLRNRPNLSPMVNIYQNYMEAVKSTEFKSKCNTLLPLILLNNFASPGKTIGYDPKYRKNVSPKEIKKLKAANPKLFNDYSIKLHSTGKNYILIIKSSIEKQTPGTTVYGCFLIYLEGRRENSTIFKDGGVIEKEPKSIYNPNGELNIIYNLNLQLFTVFRALEDDKHIFDAKFKFNDDITKAIWTNQKKEK